MLAEIEEKIQKIIEKYKRHEKDVGSPEVQIAILTGEILNLSEHLKIHKQDKNSKIGLFRKLAKRKKLLNYLKRKNPERYQELIQDLQL